MSQTLSLLPIDVKLQFPRALAALLQCHFQDVAGANIDISGDTITMTVREAYGGTVKFTVAGTITSAAGGLAELALTAVNLTDGLTDGITRWVYLITRTHSGQETPWWGGVLEIHSTAK